MISGCSEAQNSATDPGAAVSGKVLSNLGHAVASTDEKFPEQP